MKDLAFVFGITSNLDFALANVLIGLKKFCKHKNFDVIVYHDGLNEKSMICLRKIIDIEFILYDKSNEFQLDDKYLAIYSDMCLSRFECFGLLNKYKKVIWNDVDILIQNNIDELIEYGDKTGLAMTYSDIDFLNEANFNILIDGYNMYLPLLNSGIIVFSEKLKNPDKLMDWCYKKLEKLGKDVRYLDQGILNLLVQEFDIEIEAIDISKFCCHPLRKNANDAIIVHSYGDEKFWNSLYLRKLYPEWIKFNSQWMKLLAEYKPNIDFDKPEISVVMTIYERITFLKESIESILTQTFNNFELIIILEKSVKQDMIENELKKYKDKRIKIIKNTKKLGFAESLNVGIKNSRGKYIARMDDDDISYPDRLEKQYKFLEKNTDISILGTAVETFMLKNDYIYPPISSEEIKVYTLFSNQMFHPTVMMRKEMIEQYDLYYDSKYKTEDAELWSRAVKYVKLSNLKDVLLKYRISNQNETVLAKNDVLKSDVSIIDKQLKENLSLALNKNDLYLLSNRVSPYTYLYNRKEILKRKKRLLKIIYNENKKKNFYDKDILKEYIKTNSINNSITIRSILKKIIKPIYTRLYYRIEVLIDEKIKEINEKE